MSLLTRLPFQFSGSAYTPPPGSLSFDFVFVSTQYLCPDGADSSVFGATVFNQQPGALVPGFSATTVGTPKAELYKRYLSAAGTDFLAVGELYAANTRFLYASGIAPRTSVSAPYDVSNWYYRRPDANNVNFAFFSTYTPPTSSSLAFDYSQGTVFRYVSPYGYSFVEFGSPATRRLQEFAYPSAFTTLSFGFGSIRSNLVPVYPVGIAPSNTWGLPKLKYTQFVHTTGASYMAFGTNLVAFYIRYVSQTAPWVGQTGSPTVIFRTRTIEVPWTVFTQYGTPLVGRNVTITLAGFNADRYGEPALVLGNVLYPSGINSLELGASFRVSRSPQVSAASTWDSMAFGRAELYNLRQYIAQLYDLTYDLIGNRGFGLYTSIENRNKYLGVTGFLAGRVGIGTDIYLAARVATALGIEPGSDPQVFQIAHRVRWVYPDGLDSLWISLYPAIYNAAAQIKPFAIPAPGIGTPIKVESNLQTIRHHSGSDTEFGSLVCGIKVRYVDQIFSRDSVDAGFPWVSLYARTLAPSGFDPSGRGVPAVLGPFFTIIAPRWLKGPDRFGDGYVQNKIPQAFTIGWDFLDMSSPTKHWVSFGVRTVSPDGFGPEEYFGRHVIKDRRQWLYPLGLPSMSFSIALQVALANPYLPSTREIQVEGFCLGFSGVAYDPTKVFGTPAVQSSPFPEGLDATQWGDTWIRMQGCITHWYYADSQFSFGRPTVDAARYIQHAQSTDMTQWGKPRLSPWTIWATMDTPQQAADNHPDGEKFYELDTRRGFGGGAGPWWGTTDVTNRNRTIYQSHSSSQSIGPKFGVTEIENRWRFLYPDGIKSLLIGYPKLPYRQRVLGVGADMSRLGSASLRHDPLAFTQYILAGGLSFTQWGAADPQLWIRNLYASGFVATQYGNNNPMVHFPRKLYPSGYVASQFGSSMIAFRIRYLQPVGDDFFISEPSYDGFDLSGLVVVNKTTPVTAKGADSQTFGQASLALTHLIIRPYQIVGSRCMGHNVIVQGV